MNSMANAQVMFSDIVFNITSASSNMSLDEIRAFQEKAGLTYHSMSEFKERPAFFQVCAKKE